MSNKQVTMPKETKLFINGEFQNSTLGKTYEITNPTTEEVICQVPLASSEDVDRAVQAAEKAFKGAWKDAGYRGRHDLLIKLAQVWERDIDSLNQLECFNNGSCVTFMRATIEGLANEIKYHAGWADKLDGRQIPLDGNYHAYSQREPIGVCGLIVAWNFPLWCIIVKLAPALAMGNTVVLKPADATPLTALKLAELFVEVGFPPGVFNVVTGDGPTTGQALSVHPRIRKIAFTGSVKIGREILRASADSNLKQVQLELGGKSPIVIFPDVDIKEAASIAGNACLGNSGQSCDAASRTFVHEKIYDEFVSEMAAFAKNLVVGNPLDEKTQIGPLINKSQFERVNHYIEVGKKEGARVAYDGNEREKPKVGYFTSPVIFADVTDEMTIAKEEIFGPVMSIIKYSDVDEVIERCNNTEYGLAAGVVSNNINNIMKITKNVEAGTIWGNTYASIFPQCEFGGFKQSGFGREGGVNALHEWTQLKSVIISLK
ncbi:retinal dehydrogenase [Acrasis kona]|uniref:Retinal dehydrogenase n=1 Tax=Acrasis kona TaxID=1008807 RepID=A0AAW2Z7M2_9EUKA